MAKTDPRLSHQTLKVLSAFMEHPKEPLSGSDILKKTGMLSGTLYPILMRFERAGWLKSEWEEPTPSEMGRPRKRLYRISPRGYNKANAALAELRVSVERPAWSF
jgi:PadR family transcriptional regulator, regulatory protein PadR